MYVVDFVIIRGQQSFDEEKETYPIEINIENDKIQNMFDKFSKNIERFSLEGILFSGPVINNTEKIFLQTTSISDAKYGLVNDDFKQVIDMINLKEIEKWDEIITSSRWENTNFQSQKEDRQVKHFAYNFTTNNKGDLLNSMLKLVDADTEIIKFIEGGKKFPIIKFLMEFLA